MTHKADALLKRVRDKSGPILFLTGAGISQESGVPTFRGEEGYWRHGSTNYRPTELATSQAFDKVPDVVWSWYLHRRAVCRAATPNTAHHAIACLEKALGDGMHLISQNVDGLHRRAGSTESRSFYIHGDIDRMRCASYDSGACAGTYPIPETVTRLPTQPPKSQLTVAEWAALRCPGCGGLARPHVLWFDECYDEKHFHMDSALELADRARLLVVIGTAGETNLPTQIVGRVAILGKPILVINTERSRFSDLATRLRDMGSLFLRGKAGEHVPELCEALAHEAGVKEAHKFGVAFNALEERNVQHGA